MIFLPEGFHKICPFNQWNLNVNHGQSGPSCCFKGKCLHSVTRAHSLALPALGTPHASLECITRVSTSDWFL